MKKVNPNHLALYWLTISCTKFINVQHYSCSKDVNVISQRNNRFTNTRKVLSPNEMFSMHSRFYKIISALFLIFLFSGSLCFGQTGTFAWYNGSTGNVWNATDVSKTFTISCGTGCTVDVTMTIIDPNNRNCDPDTYTTNPFDTGNGCLPYPNGTSTEVDNVTGNGTIIDPWDSDCNPIFTQTNGSYGLNFLTFAVNAFQLHEYVTIRYTFSKPVYLSNYTIGDIDYTGLHWTFEPTLNQLNLSKYEAPGNSYQDEIRVTAKGANGLNVPIAIAAGSAITVNPVTQTAKATYNSELNGNVAPADPVGTIALSSTYAIKQLDIIYSNGPEDASDEQAHPEYYGWWVNGGTYTMSNGVTQTQPAKGTTNGASDNQAVRLSGFTFQACPDFTFARTNSTVCAGQTATIGVTASNGTAPYTYSWVGPSGFTSTSQNPSITNVTSAQEGVYTVTAIDVNGCEGTTTAQVTVNPVPTPTINSNLNICSGATVNLTSSGGGTYAWAGPNSFISALQNPSITSATTAATGTYILTVTGSNACTATAQTVVTVNATPSPTVNSPTICSGASATLTVSNCAGTVTWSNGLPSGITATVSPTTTTSYTATCTVGTCVGTAVSTVTVNATPSPTVNSPTICSGASATLTVSNCAGTVTWSNGLPSGTTATVSPTTTTSYTATCTVGTCVGTAVSTVTVNPLPNLNVVSTVCSPNLQTYTITFSSNGTVTSSAGIVDNNAKTVSNISVGTNVTLTATLNNCTTDIQVTSPNCTCPVVSQPISGGDVTTCSNLSIPALSVTVGTNESANWYNSAGNLLASNTLTYTPTIAGSYFVEAYNLTTSCKSATKVQVNLIIKTSPIITPTVIQATCNGTTANNNAKIKFSAVNGDRYNIVLGSSFNGTGTYASASNLVTGTGSKLNIVNPSTAVQYTIRVYNGNDTCYSDQTVTLNPMICVFECEPSKCLDLKIKIN